MNNKSSISESEGIKARPHQPQSFLLKSEFLSQSDNVFLKTKDSRHNVQRFSNHNEHAFFTQVNHDPEKPVMLPPALIHTFTGNTGILKASEFESPLIIWKPLN